MEYAHIRPLPPEVIGQIAAGEVVERPAAAIKELVENSMDAGATAITVDIRDGGLTSFRVADNGCGIQPADIRMAFARHATSKIRTAEDLYGVPMRTEFLHFVRPEIKFPDVEALRAQQQSDIQTARKYLRRTD